MAYFFNNCVNDLKHTSPHETLKRVPQILLDTWSYLHIDHRPYNCNIMGNVRIQQSIQLFFIEHIPNHF